MGNIVVFKGQYEVIIRPEFSPKAEQLYRFMENFSQTMGYSVNFVETKSYRDSVNEHLGPDTRYIMGHSNGAVRILRNFDASANPLVSNIVLFDPAAPDLNLLGRQNTNSLVFLSRPYRSVHIPKHNYTVVELDDDHYFNSSFTSIEQALKKVIKPI